MVMSVNVKRESAPRVMWLVDLPEDAITWSVERIRNMVFDNFPDAISVQILVD